MSGGPGVDSTFARRCHICGGGMYGYGQACIRWCPICLETYGEKRRPVSEMAEGEKRQEMELLLSPPYEIPFAFIIRRVMELKGEAMDFADLCKLEGEMESRQDRPMFVWPPPQPGEFEVEPVEPILLTHGHRQPVDTLRGMQQVELPPDASEATPKPVEETVSSEFDLHQQTLPHGQWPRIKTPPPK
jgi:hypothetical protein